MIIDEVKVYFKAGNGGEGSFSSMKYSARRVIGGGGDGGRGGDVILKVSPHLSDLIKFNERRKFVAENGEKGKEFNKKGKHGQSLFVPVPKGTQIVDLEGNLIIDLNEDNQEYLICKGGSEGKGNFKKMYSLPAQPGEEKEVILYYCIPNDVAIAGFANTGKTSLFNKLTGKSYAVADYPFTTKSCVWAPIEIEFRKFTIMDTPPVKKNTKNIYLENSFLKHLFRSKIILLVSDNPGEFKSEFSALKKEISSFDKLLTSGKKIFYLLNKVDKIDKNIIDLKGVMPVSTIDDEGIEVLKKKIIKALKEIDRKAQEQSL
ncbi:MAG: 50S ribosome-binding GTPase [Candidatus Omnitrophica bacterium]|jgi:GTP-binding protein|nr:50S ribosome-binding GTPase [Candidatus Omnitrophota bacterium]